MAYYNTRKASAGAQRNVRRYVRTTAKNAVRAVQRGAKRYVRSGALARDIGRVAGSGPAALVRQITGHGDYRIHKNPSPFSHKSHLGRGITEHGTMGPKHHHKALEKGEMIISHSEYMGDLVCSGTSGAFLAQNYAINPANQGTFPWLSSVAVNFQDYQFTKLVFEFRPLVSESTSSSTGALLSMGSVILAIQYDSVLGPYTSKATCENSDGSMSSKPSERCFVQVECNPKFNPLGVLYTSVLGLNSSGFPQVSSVQQDPRMNLLGIFEAASVGVPTASSTPISLGELWCHYECCMYKPQLNANLSAELSAHYLITTPTVTNFFGATVPSPVTNNTLFLNFTGNTFSFPLSVTVGSFFCMWSVVGTTPATIAPPVITVANGSLVTAFTNTGTFQTLTTALAPNSGVAADSEVIICFIVSVNAPGASLCTVTFANSSSSIPGGTVKGDLFVTPYNTLMS